MIGLIDIWMDGWMDGWMNEWMNRRMDGSTNSWNVITFNIYKTPHNSNSSHTKSL